MSQIHVMHITYDMRIGGTEMVIKNIIDGLTPPKNNTERNSQDVLIGNPQTQDPRLKNHGDDEQHTKNSTERHAQDDTDHHSQDDTDRHSRDGLIGNLQSQDPRLKNQANNDFKMSVLCIESPLGPFSEELKQNGIEFFELNRQPGFDINLIKKIRQTIKNNQVDIIHCHQYTPWVYGVIAAAFTKSKVIFTEHGRFYPDSSTWKRKLINPILNLFTDQVTAISKATKQALVEFENIPGKSIDVIYNGIAPLEVNQEDVKKLRVELAIPEEHTILGTIARFDPIKNHTMMLKAFSLVLEAQPNATLIIVGDGEERANIEACIKELNIANNVILTGYQAKPKNYLALMDIYLLSSLSEGTSMTLLEAMSLGKPCVVTDAGGNSEIIINKSNGLVTPNNEANKFSDALLQIMNDKSLNLEYSQAATSQYHTNFTIKIMNKNCAGLYDLLSN